MRLRLLEEIFKDQKGQYASDFNVRIQRAFSWFNKATMLDQDIDLQYLSFWICLKALYQQDLGVLHNHQALKVFLSSVILKDQQRKIEKIVWGQCNQKIIWLLENKHLTQSYWDYQHKKISLEMCQQALQQDKQNICVSIEQRNTTDILKALFTRFYTLNEQIIQGGSNYNSSINCRSLHDSCVLLNRLLPIFMLIVLENSDLLDVAKPYYPMHQFS